MIYQIELTDIENLAFSTVTPDRHDWIENAAKERCRIAIDDIVSICVKRCLDEGLPIPGSKDTMVTYAFEQGWVSSQ